MPERYGMSGRKMNVPPDPTGTNSESAEGMPKAETLLHFLRHARKAGGNDVPHEEDLVMEITEQGWDESFSAGRKVRRLPGAQTVAIGSDRLRARQTSAATRAAQRPGITGTERSIEEIDEALGETGSTRVWVNHGLAMPFVKGVTPGVERTLEAYERKQYLSEVLKLHQEDTERGEPKGSSIHAKEVHGIASIIARYARITPKLVENPTVPQANERFLGTHGGVQEAFWIELVRKMKDEAEVEKLLAAVPNGINYHEGMDVDITAESRDGEPNIRITFNVGTEENRYEFDEAIPVSTIQEIMKEFGPEPTSEDAGGGKLERIGAEAFGGNSAESLEAQEEGPRGDQERIYKIKGNLARNKDQERSAAEEIEVKEALAQVIDRIQEQKIQIQKRIEEKTHFKKAFPFLSFFGGFGVTVAKFLYEDEYSSKVEAKEQADQNTLERLNERESQAEQKITNLERKQDGPASLREMREFIAQFHKEDDQTGNTPE